ncbi:hypothetical protein [Streptomyces sp. NPDC057702]|uniref:hypothetical protein n=1 Tax=unclassified Streptomyces TaxID=2593676 RepID=UPI0036B0A135
MAIGSPTFATAVPERAAPTTLTGPPLPAAPRERAERWERAGRTTMVVRHGGRSLGVIGVMDTPRPEAAAIVARPRGLDVRRAVLISGDVRRADTVAGQVGLDAAWGGLSPAGEVAGVERLRAEGTVRPWSATASTTLRRWPSRRWARPGERPVARWRWRAPTSP